MNEVTLTPRLRIHLSCARMRSDSYLVLTHLVDMVV